MSASGYERFRVERFGAVSGVSIDAIFALGSRVATAGISAGEQSHGAIRVEREAVTRLDPVCSAATQIGFTGC